MTSTLETKIEFQEIRQLLANQCLSTLGKTLVDEMTFLTDPNAIRRQLALTHEMRLIKQSGAEFPANNFFDVRTAIARLRLEGTHIDEQELFDLRRSLDTIAKIVDFLSNDIQATQQPHGPQEYPALQQLATDIPTFPSLIRAIDQILDKYGNIRDDASPELAKIRKELVRTESSISRTLYNILHQAQTDGLVEKDVNPTMRDGRLVIPIAPALRRRISGIVHDESASGKTVFVEPTEVVEANNRVRELESQERHEIQRILIEISSKIRPDVQPILHSFHFLAQIDFIQAKARLAEQMHATEPTVKDKPMADLRSAVHPLLRISLERQSKQVVPLDIELTPEQRILIISGPNAGGKSVCLKTLAILQYMLQCGLSVPASERSIMGVFRDILIDIGDQQSIADDLSTYSSHLLNMKQMIRAASPTTLLLIDEMGSGTEPLIGGAIAEAVLKQFCKQKAFALITTHYQNLKRFADENPGVVNAAMLYDRQALQPLFRLAIGQPGSSFAIEIARKTGLPEQVIADASEMVGQDYVQSDKYLQDINRDRRYWADKRQQIHAKEKQLDQAAADFETQTSDLRRRRQEIIEQAKEQAQELLREANRRIENTIREIREQQAEKEQTKKLRQELDAFKQTIEDTSASDSIDKKIKQLKARQERKAKRKADLTRKKEKENDATTLSKNTQSPTANSQLNEGSTVRIKGLTSVGTIERIDGDMATVVFGTMRTKMRTDRLEPASPQTITTETQTYQTVQSSKPTRATIDNHRRNFNPQIDVRGMRGEEAINAITYYIDDAILFGATQVRILHGTGNGILRQLIRQYLATQPAIANYHDEDVRFGGTGITVVEF